MKKRRKFFFICLGITVLLTGAMVSLGIWALNSAEGTRVLFKALSIFSPVQIDAQKIQGRLRDELKLQGVRIRWPQGEIRADRPAFALAGGRINESPGHCERTLLSKGLFFKIARLRPKTFPFPVGRKPPSGFPRFKPKWNHSASRIWSTSVSIKSPSNLANCLPGGNGMKIFWKYVISTYPAPQGGQKGR